jgi:hypothetical protein
MGSQLAARIQAALDLGNPYHDAVGKFAEADGAVIGNWQERGGDLADAFAKIDALPAIGGRGAVQIPLKVAQMATMVVPTPQEAIAFGKPESVAIADLTATQGLIDPEHVKRLLQQRQTPRAGSFRLPLAVRQDHQVLLIDGHHRIVSRWAKGHTTALVHVVPADKLSHAPVMLTHYVKEMLMLGLQSWDEAEHPRDDIGRFAESDGGDGEDDDFISTPSEAFHAIAKGEPATIAREDLRGVLDRAVTAGGVVDLTNLRIEGTPVFKVSGKDRIPRDEMPQIPRKEQERFLEMLDAKGVQIKHEKVSAMSLHPTQSGINAVRVAGQMAAFESGEKTLRAIMVSKDHKILDGHHRWAVGVVIELEKPGTKFPVLRIMKTQKEALALMNAYVKAHGVAKVELTDDQQVTLDLDGGWDESLHPRDDIGRFAESGSESDGPVRTFTSEQGYQWHEQGPVAAWAQGLSKAEAAPIDDYASFGYSDINQQLRGTFKPSIINEFVREATPEEQTTYRSTFGRGAPSDFEPDDPTNQVADGRIVHNVFYRNETGEKVEWSIQRAVPDFKRVADLKATAEKINETISTRGYVLLETMRVDRAAYIPGLSEEDLRARVGSTLEEPGFTSTMVGDAGGRLTGYVIHGKYESLYKRFNAIKGHEDEAGTAMRVHINLPSGTKVIPVEAVRRLEWTHERDVENQIDFSKPVLRGNTYSDPKQRRESEVLLGSGAKFRITKVGPGETVQSYDGSLKPVKIVDVDLTYIGGGSSQGAK